MTVAVGAPMQAAAGGPFDGITDFYFTQGVLGVTCVGLLLVCWRLWNLREAERKLHEEEIKRVTEERLAEGRSMIEVVRQLKAQQEVFLTAVKERR